MEAIDFIFRRETGQLPATLRLWRYNDSDSDEPLYTLLKSNVAELFADQPEQLPACV